MIEPSDGLPMIAFPSAAEFEAWLMRSADAKGVWLKLARKGSGAASISKQEAVDAALCHGWIDGQTGSLDETWWLTRFTPRRSRSRWSEVNRTRITELMAQGRVAAAGLAEVEAAKADGRWDAAYAPQSTASAPADLVAALEADATAKALFERLDGRNRYAILHRLSEAKRPETRAARIKKFVAMLARGELIYPR